MDTYRSVISALAVFLVLFVAFGGTFLSLNQSVALDTSHSEGPCPKPSQAAQKIARDFLTSKKFTDNRREANVTHLKGETPKALRSGESHGDEESKKVHVSPKTCKKLNEKYNSIINGDNPHKPNYFKVKDKYLVFFESVTPNEKKSNVITFGMNTLIVLDSNLNEIKGWSG